MMVEMFVHPSRPLLRRNRAEEGMRMLGAFCLPTLVKLLDAGFELFLLSGEISLVGDHKMLVGGTVPGKRLVIGKDGPDEWPEYPANQQPG